MREEIDFSRIDDSTDCISGYDLQLNIVLWNKTIARKYNISEEQAVGKNLLELFPFISKDDFRVKCLRQAMEEKKSFFFSYLPYIHSTGNYTQLIKPVNHHCRVLNIVRDHEADEKYVREDLLKPLMTVSEFSFRK